MPPETETTTTPEPATPPPATEPTTSSATTTTEATTAEAKPATATSLLNEAPTPAGAPDTYANWNLPEGWTLDEGVKTQVNDLFKELNLSQEGGQKALDFYIKQTEDAAQQPYKLYEAMRQGWRDEISRDPVIGGKLDQVKQTVGRALNVLGDTKLAQSFREAMDLTGAGDNPAFIRVLYALAQRVTESSHVVGNGPAPTGQGNRPSTGRPSMAQAMYPDLSQSS